MNQLIKDFNEAIDLLREKRMKQVWEKNLELKKLSNQESQAEREYQDLELDNTVKSTIDTLISSINELDDYYEKMIYRQGLKDGYLLGKFTESVKNDDVL